MSNDSTDPHAILERLERWSARATLLIFVAIIIEIASEVYFHAGSGETYINVVANAMIALGLGGEFYFILMTIKWTRQANAQSDMQVATARNAANRALVEQERLRLRSLELELKILRIGPRSLTVEQAENISKSMKGEPYKPLIKLSHSSEPEAAKYAGELTNAFRLGGAAVEFEASYMYGAPIGIAVADKTGALQRAFKAADIDFDEKNAPPVTGGASLMIGQKAP